MSVASRRCLAIRTWSVGLTIAPSSIPRFWMLTMLYTLEKNTTRTVPATVLTIKGPRPRFNRSNPIITSFLKGVLNRSNAIIAVSENITVNRSWIIFAIQIPTIHNGITKNNKFMGSFRCCASLSSILNHRRLDNHKKLEKEKERVWQTQEKWDPFKSKNDNWISRHGQILGFQVPTTLKTFFVFLGSPRTFYFCRQGFPFFWFCVTCIGVIVYLHLVHLFGLKFKNISMN